MFLCFCYNIQSDLVYPNSLVPIKMCSDCEPCEAYGLKRHGFTRSDCILQQMAKLCDDQSFKVYTKFSTKRLIFRKHYDVLQPEFNSYVCISELLNAYKCTHYRDPIYYSRWCQRLLITHFMTLNTPPTRAWSYFK